MPIVDVVERGQHQALPVLLLVAHLHAEAGATQRLQGAQEEPDIKRQRRQGDRRNVVDPNTEDLGEEQDKPRIKASRPPLHGWMPTQ